MADVLVNVQYEMQGNVFEYIT